MFDDIPHQFVFRLLDEDFHETVYLCLDDFYHDRLRFDLLSCTVLLLSQ